MQLGTVGDRNLSPVHLLRMVSLYDNHGKRFNILRDTVVDELE